MDSQRAMRPLRRAPSQSISAEWRDQQAKMTAIGPDEQTNNDKQWLTNIDKYIDKHRQLDTNIDKYIDKQRQIDKQTKNDN